MAYAEDLNPSGAMLRVGSTPTAGTNFICQTGGTMYAKEEFLNLVGDFTWSFGVEFFIETSIGNFVWEDPDYGGNNTIRKYNGDFISWLRKSNIPLGRDKGKHIIKEYCGDQIQLIQ